MPVRLLLLPWGPTQCPAASSPCLPADSTPGICGVEMSLTWALGFEEFLRKGECDASTNFLH